MTKLTSVTWNIGTTAGTALYIADPFEAMVDAFYGLTTPWF